MKKLERTDFKHSDNKATKAYIKANPDEEVWINDIYQVAVRRGLKVGEYTICHLSIKRHDRQAVMDWRHMQWIKNQLVGEECEGCELFPKESRLVDGANQFHMWVFEDPGNGFPFGFYHRIVTEKSFFGETQRKFPESRKPADLKECEAAMKIEAEKMAKE